ncbi:MAG: cyclophilin-like fold protein, partial [Anaerolineae bacterium]
MRRIKITAGAVSATATLSENPTADAIWNALPIEARANTWGEEIYFSIPVRISEAPDAQELVALGDLGYWPPGSA